MNSIEATKIFDLTLDWDRKRPTPPQESHDNPLEVNVLGMSRSAAAKALQKATALARGLNARLHIAVAQEVSYAVPLDNPPVNVEFEEQSVCRLAENCGVEARIDILLCRDAEETFARRLAPHSVALIGTRRDWWPWREKRLARRLRGLGHEVIVIDGKGK